MRETEGGANRNRTREREEEKREKWREIEGDILKTDQRVPLAALSSALPRTAQGPFVPRFGKRPTSA